MSAVRSLSLRHALAIAMSAVAAVAVLLAVVVAGQELRRIDRITADERLALVVERLETMASRSAEQRYQLKERTAADPAVVRTLLGEPTDVETLTAALAPLRAPGDSTLPVQIWNRQGVVVFSDLPIQPAAEQGGRSHVPLDSAPAYGSFHDRGGELTYYSTAPVRYEDDVIGWVVQLRRIGSPAAAEQFEPLIGERARILFHYPGDSLWITLAGQPVSAPVAQPPWDTTIVVDASGDRMLMRARQVRAAPWSVVVEMPDEIIGGTGRFMTRMGVVGLVLVLLATAAALLLSRRMTGGLRRLSDASTRLAAGDYSARVEPESGGEEMHQLALAFNSMAAQVAGSHAALEAQLLEARRLTERLTAANEDAERARMQAEDADRAKSDFLATMSHEIRTPINAVLGFCQVLELDELPEEKRREYLSRTQRAARQLAALVDDVLDLSKIQSGNLDISVHPTAVRPVADAAIALVGETAARKQLHLDVSIDPELEVNADVQRLQQILLNVLSNAVKFTPDGGRVAVSAVRENGGGDRGTVRVLVQDSGIGIPPEQLEAIFEPFVQGHTGYTREYGGTGLGLSISRRLARLMDGDLEVESTPGQGSRFTLRLPAPAATPAGG